MVDLKIKKLKRRRVVYIIIAAILIALNLFTDLVNYAEGKLLKQSESASYNFGYIIGGHFFLLFGLLLFYRVLKIGKRINELKSHQLNEEIDAIGAYD